jgi:hypothetical protein
MRRRKETWVSKNLKKRQANFKGGFTTIKNDLYMVGCTRKVFLFIRKIEGKYPTSLITHIKTNFKMKIKITAAKNSINLFVWM